MSTAPVEDPTDDAAERALDDLVGELDRCIRELTVTREHARQLQRHRRAGRTWTEIVSRESRPLVVERITAVLTALARAGHEWRREQAAALQGEQVSINRIAAMFGVTRQRISALLRETDRSP